MAKGSAGRLKREADYQTVMAKTWPNSVHVRLAKQARAAVEDAEKKS